MSRRFYSACDDDVLLFDRVRHRAYALGLHTVSISPKLPLPIDVYCRYYFDKHNISSSDIQEWCVSWTDDRGATKCRVYGTYTRDEMELLFRKSSYRTKYLVPILARGFVL